MLWMAVLLHSIPSKPKEEDILVTGSDRQVLEQLQIKRKYLVNACFQVSSMGNDLSAIGGALATVGTSIAAGVTFGQVKELNQAVVSTAEFTANKVSG